MKTLVKRFSDLQKSGRWDIDYHLPAEKIKVFPDELIAQVSTAADVVRDTRDPSREESFEYVDISAVDITIGVISTPQQLEGNEAPSRARKVIRAFDILVSTCRPTRGAIAVVPPHLHNQIASTGFSVLRPRQGTNPFYLQYALRLPSTLEQFRKWSTGSSYPAILDGDVAKTLIPLPDTDTQDLIARNLIDAMHERNLAVRNADIKWNRVQAEIVGRLSGTELDASLFEHSELSETAFVTTQEIWEKIRTLPPLTTQIGIQEALEAEDDEEDSGD